MSRKYTIVSGDTLSGIAARFGFATWQEIYNSDENTAFKAKRPDPNVIFPGDELFLPGLEDAPEGEVVDVKEGDTLCQLAIQAGFPDCKAIRDHAKNKDKPFLKRPLQPGDDVFVPEKDAKAAKKGDKAKHKFVRAQALVSLRFVHGSKDKPFEADDSLSELNVSNMRPDRGGDNRKGVLPDATATAFNEIGDGDPDTFKVEVTDIRTKKDEIKVMLEALRPVFDASGAITGHARFDRGVITAGERGKRSLEVKPKKVAGHKLFRSPYLKLVVDQQDKDARPKQTLLTAPAPDIDERIEILDQRVQAAYEPDWCPGSGDEKCRIEISKPVGKDKLRVKVALHILRKTRTGDGVVTLPVARKRALKFMRELYAQCNMSMKFEVQPRLVPPAQNLIAIANEAGASAVGGKKIKVEVTVDGTKFEAEATTAPGDDPIATAIKLKSAIDLAAAAQAPPVVVNVKTDENPIMAGQPVGSADVIVGDPLTQVIAIKILTNGDANHPAAVARLTTTKITEFGGANSAVGTLDERVLIKNYETGSDRIDVYVVGAMSDNSFGEAWSPTTRSPAAQRPNAMMLNSVIFRKAPFTSDNTVHTTMPHECGHVLMDLVHADDPEEMMGAGSPVGNGERVVNGPKRISDPVSNANFINFNAGGGKVNPTLRLRTSNPGIITAF